jgi:hypothetical protein
VFPTRHVVLTRKPHRVVESLQELRSERVGTIKGTSMAEMVRAVGMPAANVDDSFASGGLPAALKENRFTACVDGCAVDREGLPPRYQAEGTGPAVPFWGLGTQQPPRESHEKLLPGGREGQGSTVISLKKPVHLERR